VIFDIYANDGSEIINKGLHEFISLISTTSGKFASIDYNSEETVYGE